MKVVFLDDVEGVARAGDVKQVADGYARNFLLPRKLAAAATTATLQQAEAKAKAIAKEQEKVDDAARVVADKISASPVKIAAKVGEEGRLFGSVTATNIADEIKKLTGTVLEHRQVLLEAPIKEVGTSQVFITLSRNVRAEVTVEVTGEE